MTKKWDAMLNSLGEHIEVLEADNDKLRTELSERKGYVESLEMKCRNGVEAVSRLRKELRGSNRQWYCCYCKEPLTTVPGKEEDPPHFMECPKHPMREVEKERDTYRSSANKFQDLFERVGAKLENTAKDLHRVTTELEEVVLERNEFRKGILKAADDFLEIIGFENIASKS